MITFLKIAMVVNMDVIIMLVVNTFNSRLIHIHNNVTFNGKLMHTAIAVSVIASTHLLCLVKISPTVDKFLDLFAFIRNSSATRFIL